MIRHALQVLERALALFPLELPIVDLTGFFEDCIPLCIEAPCELPKKRTFPQSIESKRGSQKGFPKESKNEGSLRAKFSWQCSDFIGGRTKHGPDRPVERIGRTDDALSSQACRLARRGAERGRNSNVVAADGRRAQRGPYRRSCNDLPVYSRSPSGSLLPFFGGGFSY